MNMRLKMKKTTGQQVLLLILLACMVAYAIFCLFCHLNPNGLNSDIVNETLYKKLSWEQKTLFPNGYICSKEGFSTRPVLIYWLYYGITNNFMLSYRLECVTVLLLGLLAFYWLVSEMGLSAIPKAFGMCLFVLWAAWDPAEFAVFLYNDAYSLFVLSMLCTLALYIRLYKEIKKERNLLSKPIVKRAVAIWVIAAFVGYGTPKMTIVLYLPIFVVEVWGIFRKYIDKEKNDYIDFSLVAVSMIAVLINFLSYVIFLNVHRDFIDAMTFRIASLDTILSWEVLSTQLNAILSACGLSFEGKLLSWYGIRYLCRCGIVFLVGVYVVRSFREKDREVVKYVCVSLLILFFAEVLHADEHMHVSTDTARRYYFPIYILIPIACGAALDKWAKGECQHINAFPYLICVCFVLGLFFPGVIAQEKQYENEQPVLVTVADYIEDNGYQYVTATYEYAGIITGYTEGKVGSQSGNMSDLSQRLWMIDRNLYTDERIGVPNILLLTDEEEGSIMSQNSSASLLLREYAQKVQEIDRFNLYALDENPFTLVNKIDDQYSGGLPAEGVDEKIVTPNALGFQNRNSSYNDMGELVSDGSEACILWGPYTQSIEGTYDVTLHYVVDEYTTDDSGVFDVALNAERQAAVEFFADEQTATIDDVTLSDGAAFEARVEVPEGMIVRIQSIEYEREE